MTRIIAGAWGGRRIEVPRGDATRPTTDRVRESLFASLTSEFGSFDQLSVLDLFAGSGALGLETASRGAEHVDLVESDKRAASVISRNIAALKATPAVVHQMPAEKFLARAAQVSQRRYDLIMLDPPYSMPSGQVGDLVGEAAALLAEDGLIVVERSSRTSWQWPVQVTAVRDRRYGETILWYGR